MQHPIRTSIIILLSLSLMLGGVWFYRFMTSSSSDISSDEPVLFEKKAPTPPENDQDFDGVPDDQEAMHGTSNTLVDTDGDGFTDKQELEKTKTDPTKADTDGDGFSDFTEVANGYDPLVP